MLVSQPLNIAAHKCGRENYLEFTVHEEWFEWNDARDAVAFELDFDEPTVPEGPKAMSWTVAIHHQSPVMLCRCPG